MKRLTVLAAALAGVFLLAGAGEARADSCDSNNAYWSYRLHGGGRRWGYGGGYWDRPVYRYTQVVVPAQVVCPAPAYSNTLVVNIMNANGSYTPVTLRQQGNVYVGPRGEQYLSVPTEDQLKAVYGLK